MVKVHSTENLIEICKQHQNQHPMIFRDINFFLNEKNITNIPIEINPTGFIKKDSLQLIETEFFPQYLNSAPLDYILNNSNFYGYSFFVDENVLIPRPETELILDYVIDMGMHNQTIIDAGTGSGCIGAVLSKELTDSNIYAIDKSIKALEVAKYNFKKLDCRNIQTLLCDWLASFATNSIDVIVSNPPYIKADDPHLDELHYEPKDALIGGKNGLIHFDRIFFDATRCLKSEGYLIFEHGFDQQEQIIFLSKEYSFNLVTQINDLQGHNRGLVFKK
tara:strand:+ start:27 stop:857 length:831 start_codon:yes stop_codon:yes gene_type:complete